MKDSYYDKFLSHLKERLDELSTVCSVEKETLLKTLSIFVEIIFYAIGTSQSLLLQKSNEAKNSEGMELVRLGKKSLNELLPGKLSKVINVLAQELTLPEGNIGRALGGIMGHLILFVKNEGVPDSSAWHTERENITDQIKDILDGNDSSSTTPTKIDKVYNPKKSPKKGNLFYWILSLILALGAALLTWLYFSGQLL